MTNPCQPYLEAFFVMQFHHFRHKQAFILFKEFTHTQLQTAGYFLLERDEAKLNISKKCVCNDVD